MGCHPNATSNSLKLFRTYTLRNCQHDKALSRVLESGLFGALCVPFDHFLAYEGNLKHKVCSSNEAAVVRQQMQTMVEAVDHSDCMQVCHRVDFDAIVSLILTTL